MLRRATAVVLATMFALPSAAAPVTDFKQISKVIDGVPTAANVSLKKRMDNCKMKIHPELSWMETRDVAWRDYGAAPGATVVKLVFDVPPAPRQPGPAGVKPNPPQTNIVAIFVVDHGKPSAVSAWANVLLNRPVPLGYDASNNC